MTATGIVIKVGIAEMNIAKAPDMIRTAGLGSCVGVVLYDLKREVGGMAHIMLPDSSLARGKSVHLAKYADTAVERLIELLAARGVPQSALKAKMAGGAQMFRYLPQNDLMRIGPRNVEAVKRQLERFRIPLVAEDTGGSNGRTIEFNPKTGILMIRTVNLGIKEI